MNDLYLADFQDVVDEQRGAHHMSRLCVVLSVTVTWVYTDGKVLSQLGHPRS